MRCSPAPSTPARDRWLRSRTTMAGASAGLPIRSAITGRSAGRCSLPPEGGRLAGNQESMECPKCAAAVADGTLECPRCGVVFAKLERREHVGRKAGARNRVADPTEATFRTVRWLLIAGLAVWTWQFARVPMGVAVADSVLHLPNLVFHEAGHVILGVFGRFAGVLGGSLFQFALPLALVVVFLR